MPKHTLLIIDDEEGIRSLIKDYFELEEFMIFTAANGKEALLKVEKSPDIILLDINMPEMDGLTLCKKIRDIVNCPIVFLTARVDEQDRIAGLMAGGDDYIMKPFSMDELHARVLAHLRREERKNKTSQVRFFGELVINLSDRTVKVNEKECRLTKTEFDILEVLCINQGQVFTKEQIYEKLWGFDKDGDSAIITEHIRRIRGKLKKEDENTYIETVWGVGYRWIG